MENHDHNGHGEGHDDHATEGNRQYYPKGWWMPLVGLLVVALGFTTIGYFAFSVSGTDKWGKSEQCCVEGEHHEGESCGDEKEAHGGHDANTHKHHEDKVKEAEGLMAPGGHDSTAKDSTHQAPSHHEHDAAGEHH
ncbi:MAG: hypothetical protein M3R17_11095 [Bacteroidota bacterium]|nr:hypothetical protein [Bacteroidota bacterium]